MKISSFDNIISLDEFTYVCQVDRHEKCSFSVSVTDEKIGKCSAVPGTECSVEHNDFKFTGVVTEIVKIKTFVGWQLQVVLTGKTLEFDKEKKQRVFQNDKKQIPDIIKCTSMAKIGISLDKQRDIEEIIVQDCETDWNFVLRLAKYFGIHLFPGEKTRLGIPLKEVVTLEYDDIIESKICLRKKGSEGVCRTNKKLKFGQQVKIENTTFFVDSVIFRKEKEEYITEYHLSDMNAENSDNRLPVYVLFAKVKDNDDPEKKGRISVEFLEPYEDAMSNDAMWIEADSVWASNSKGFSCIPFVDDEVVVEINDRKARVAASRRVETFDSRYEDCNTRYIFVNDKTFLSLNEERMLLENSKFKLELSEEKLLVKFGDNVNLLLDENGVSIKTDKSAVEVASAIKMKTDNFETDGGNGVNIKASKININGNRGVNIN